ncbi:MAG TPA: bifunctional DNA-formamidopyrimidine glycosylase/DNA-(apurinic or apyrimidinic site) lyase [Rhizomicrobium sp.]|nr:bifunctional DNA-formamidopyrimidine glycosylase/DNA-(apurinic or apyrimidinic site) lyase [Rhizomicrobium sp.]
MPELPEVETVRRGLEPVMAGFRFTKVVTRRADLRRPFPPNFAQRLTGRKIMRLWRRAKYLLADLDDGETLVIHLGMSGRMAIHAKDSGKVPGAFAHSIPPPEAGNGKHDHVIFETDAPARIVFSDHRRFGLMTLTKSDTLDDDPLFKGLGPEPLSRSFDAARLKAALTGKRTPIKSALLDQRVVAGLGNIYVCEALFLAHISPTRLAAKVQAAKIGPLVDTIKAVLKDAIKAGGSTLRDHAQPDGSLGYFQHQFRVYDREGEPCSSDGCTGKIKRIVQAGRSTFYCSSCQK